MQWRSRRRRVVNHAAPGSVNPYAPPTTPTGHHQGSGTPSLDYYREGQDLVIRKEATLPEICIRTGQPTSGRMRTKKLSWVPPWTIVVFILIRLVGLICMLVARKTANVTFSLSEEAEAKRKQGLMIGLAVFGVGLLMSISGVVMDTGAGAMAALVGFLAVFVGIILAAVLHRPFQMRKMAGDYVYLRLKPVALDAFEAHRASHQVVATPAGHSPFGAQAPAGHSPFA